MIRTASLAGLGLLFVSCAPRQSVVWAPGVSLANSSAGIAPVAPPRTVRIESKVRLRSKERTLNFETVVVADSTRGRLEALGPFGMALATVVWEDTSWQVWLPAQGALVRGSGDSLSLPVVGMRTLRPREFLAPFLGRAICASTGTPLRRLAQTKTTSVFVPVEPMPDWSISIDRASGLPRYRQFLRGDRESERHTYGAWSLRAGIPVPDSLVRTGRDSQQLAMRLTSWEPMDSLPAAMLVLPIEKPVDTILVVRDGTGRQRFHIRPAGGSTAQAESVVDSLQEDDDESGAVDDSTATTTEDPASDEDELPAE